MKFHGTREAYDEDFLNASGEVSLDFMVDFRLSIIW